MTHPHTLRFEHHIDAFGIGDRTPRISWLIDTATPHWLQSAYQLSARDDAGDELWTSPVMESRDAVLVPWPGPPLRSRQRAHVSVRVRGTGDADFSPWSETATVETGLLDAADWSAAFITPDWDVDAGVAQPSPLLRREFSLPAAAVRAWLYVTALGLYEAEINGARVGDHVLTPGWTSYDTRLRYQTFDVTSLLRPGANALGAILGEGWYCGPLGFPTLARRNTYGDRMALLAQLEAVCADGTTVRVATGPGWTASSGPILASGIYAGEAYDARREQPGWSSPGFDDGGWLGVRVVERDLATLVAPAGPPVRRTQELPPLSIARSPSGRTIVDFGQNASGWLRIRVRGNAGDTITVRHAEILERGELCTAPLRDARATDTYTLRGGGLETWEPRFTFHGFRYAEVTGWPGELQPDDLRMVVVHTDMERTGWFACSDPLVERLHENAVWSMRSNFLDVPTDCPQRDERLGWTGDLAMFAPTAGFLYGAGGFLANWLADLAADQLEDGVVPMLIPDIMNRPGQPAFGIARSPIAVWSDAAVIVPWVIYQRYGDLAVLGRQYESMRRWVDAVEQVAAGGRLWDRGFQFADWLDPNAPAEHPQRAMTDTHLVATAFFAHVAGILSKTARLLGHDADHDRYRTMAAEIRAAFRREYVTPSGRTASDTQTALALLIVFGLYESDEQRTHAGDRLAHLARSGGFHVGTGFVGTAIVLDALTMTGHDDVAYRMLLEQSCPSWLYPVTQGATTIWERWDSLKPDGTVNSPTMTSFNHYALGAVCDWLHRTVGGLAPAEPGYRRIAIAPRPGGGLTHARARLRTPYGVAECAWRLEDGAMHLDLVVPPNTTATVIPVPGNDPIDVGSGTHSWTVATTAR